ncbi:hypothetical protein [Sphaerotilus sp.]|nr:hypothetical protein [Sphaerotilus sp.]
MKRHPMPDIIQFWSIPSTWPKVAGAFGGWMGPLSNRSKREG